MPVIAANVGLIAGVIAAVVVLVIVVTLVMRRKGGQGTDATAAPKPTERPESDTSPNNMPSMVAPVRPAPPVASPVSPPASSPVAPPADENKVLSTSGRVIQVPSELPAGEPSNQDLAPLEPAATAEVPSLAEASLEPSLDEPGMGTDELPRAGTAEMARVGTAEMQALSATSEKPRYRTPAAQALQEAIESMKCPKCGQATFVGRETPEELGTDGVGLFKLDGRCGACGHKAQVIDMRVG